jgi:hypothetical protein
MKFTYNGLTIEGNNEDIALFLKTIENTGAQIDGLHFSKNNDNYISMTEMKTEDLRNLIIDSFISYLNICYELEFSGWTKIFGKLYSLSDKSLVDYMLPFVEFVQDEEFIWLIEEIKGRVSRR